MTKKKVTKIKKATPKAKPRPIPPTGGGQGGFLTGAGNGLGRG